MAKASASGDDERLAPASPLADAVTHLQELVRIPTVSNSDENLVDRESFEAFIQTLARLYPATHEALSLERVHGHSLLFRWAGATSERPAVLMAHYDVVAATAEGWTHPPFDGVVEGQGDRQVIWGRGTLDDKGSVVAILDAVETLVATGFTPAHDVYLSFGHDEEEDGSGAKAIAELLERRGIRPAIVLDEGGAVVEKVFPGVRRPVAVVGVSEKGVTSITLTVSQRGGHASTPPRMPATARLARAVTRLSRSPFPARLGPTNLEMIRTVGMHAIAPLRFVFSRADFFRPLLVALFARLSDDTNAMVRTTVVVTQLSASPSANALAEEARAVVNARIAIDSSVAETVAHVTKAVRDRRVAIATLQPAEPSPVSPSSGAAWDTIASAISAVYPRAVVTPYIMLGASDSRHFTGICDHVYRFSPFEMSPNELGSLHARDERMRTSSLLAGIRFYTTLIEHL